jgi:hypothetical protein
MEQNERNVWIVTIASIVFGALVVVLTIVAVHAK